MCLRPPEGGGPELGTTHRQEDELERLNRGRVHSLGRRKLPAGPGQRGGRKLLRLLCPRMAQTLRLTH